MRFLKLAAIAAFLTSAVASAQTQQKPIAAVVVSDNSAMTRPVPTTAADGVPCITAGKQAVLCSLTVCVPPMAHSDAGTNDALFSTGTLDPWFYAGEDGGIGWVPSPGNPSSGAASTTTVTIDGGTVVTTINPQGLSFSGMPTFSISGPDGGGGGGTEASVIAQMCVSYQNVPAPTCGGSDRFLWRANGLTATGDGGFINVRTECLLRPPQAPNP